GRAIPDVRDGLKPVQRRILYSMYELGLLPNKPYKKSARVVGETLGKFHPHGDASVYDALVRMAQDFTMRYPLIEGQGNFGSIDGDPPAAMRYTEARLTKLAVEMLEDIDKNTVDMMPNFDASLEEPTVLPSKFPNLICNGTTGIAVGLATSIPPHNLTEVAEALKYLAEFPDATIEELFNFIKGPDFPTGGIITNTKEELIDIYKTSKGSITIKGKARIEKLPGNRQRIVIYEIPYQVNKVELIKKIAELVRTGKEKGISDLRDESDRTGIRIVIELKRDADAEKVLKKLYKSTPLEKNFPVNLTVLVDKQPRVLNLKELLQEFIKHRIEIITRRTLFELEKAENRLHIVEGLITALENADKVIEIVRSSKDTAQARELLTSQFNLSETQANAILDMRLSRFTSLETQKLKDESTELKQKIERYKQILSSDDEKVKVFIEETDELVRKYGDQRKTTIATEKELTFKEHFMFAILNTGRIVNYKVEDEASKADILQRIINSLSISLTEGEKIVSIQEVEGSKPIAFFTKDGKAYWSLVIDLPKGEDKLNIEGEIVGTAYQGEGEENRVFLITKKGIIKRMSDEDIFYKSQGHMVMPLNEGDELVVAVADRHPSYIGIYTKNA
ncbi:MAG: DNA topoisomerase 4 subunit A, partial [Sulfurihydrogenibium sp.]|nr:DNA topoisomerase 4 subunit A [Sulfurihydrogenibium sp.]